MIALAFAVACGGPERTASTGETLDAPAAAPELDLAAVTPTVDVLTFQ